MARKDAEAVILKYVDKLMPGGENKKLYEDLFKSMSDSEFKQFMESLENGTQVLCVVAPNDGKHKIDIKNGIKVADELGVKIFTKLTVKSEDKPPVSTANDVMVIDLPFRRAAQTITKKISVPENTKKVSILTGQPTGSSKGAKLSYPEIQVMASMGLEKMLLEALKFRGGDRGAFAALTADLTVYGKASQDALEAFSTDVESTKTLRAYLTAMHLRTTL